MVQESPAVQKREMAASAAQPWTRSASADRHRPCVNYTVSAACPHSPVASPVGEPTAQTVFRAPPDRTWPPVPGVDRQAYSMVTTDVATASEPPVTSPSIAVYLRRGRALLGIYFPQPKGVQPAVAGKRSIAGIVAVFEGRMAELPATVVNGRG